MNTAISAPDLLDAGLGINYTHVPRESGESSSCVSSHAANGWVKPFVVVCLAVVGRKPAEM
eukprot:1219124-Alexandrium_andersonii.AAC.1